MIIWQRWGILVLPFVGVGVLLGFLLSLAFGFHDASGPRNGVFVGIGLVLAAVGLYFFVRYVMQKHIDKPKPAYLLEKLPQPVVNERGVTQTHRQVPVVHPETGQQVWTQPTSTLFFVPVKYWPFVLAGIGVVVAVINIGPALAMR